MLKKIVKKLSRSLGIDLKRYNIQTSEAAKMQRLLAYHNIDLVFDVGANIGQYAKLLRELGYSGRIVVLPNLHCRKFPKLPLCPAML